MTIVLNYIINGVSPRFTCFLALFPHLGESIETNIRRLQVKSNEKALF
jgi:hypothetical protein